MLFPALGALTAIWLVLCPFLGLETGYRAVLAIGIGGGALVLAPLGIWFRQARWAGAGLGALLGVAALADPPTIGGLANFIACGSALVVAGMAPQPVVEVTRHTGAAVPSTAAAELTRFGGHPYSGKWAQRRGPVSKQQVT